MHIIHIAETTFPALLVLELITGFAVRTWLGLALSEGASPSHKRLIGFLIALTVCDCEIYHTIKIGRLDTTHLLYLLVTGGVYAGLATVPQIIDFIKGRASAPDPQKTEFKPETSLNDGGAEH